MPSLAFRGMPLHVFGKTPRRPIPNRGRQCMKTTTSLALLLAAVSLSACMDDGPRQTPQYTRAAPVQQGVDGTWSDPNGIISTFQGGGFSTRTTDTNQVLASGTYTNTAPGLVEINMTSLVRKTQTKGNW